MRELTSRQLEAITLHSTGFDVGEIANEMGISLNTVRNHFGAVRTATESHTIYGSIYKLLKIGEIAITEEEIKPAEILIELTSPRRKETLSHLMSGDRASEIAPRMRVALPTVRNHIRGLLDVFGVKSIPHLIRPGVAGGVLAPGDDISGVEFERITLVARKNREEFFSALYPGINLSNFSNHQLEILASLVPEIVVKNQDELEAKRSGRMADQFRRASGYLQGKTFDEIAEDENSSEIKTLDGSLSDARISSGRIAFGVMEWAKFLGKNIAPRDFITEAMDRFGYNFEATLLEDAFYYVRV